MSYVQELTLCLATSFQTFCELNCKRCSKSEDKFQLFLDKEVQDTGLSAFSTMSNLIHKVSFCWSWQPLCTALLCCWPCFSLSSVSKTRSLRLVALSQSAFGLQLPIDDRMLYQFLHGKNNTFMYCRHWLSVARSTMLAQPWWSLFLKVASSA